MIGCEGPLHPNLFQFLLFTLFFVGEMFLPVKAALILEMNSYVG